MLITDHFAGMHGKAEAKPLAQPNSVVVLRQRDGDIGQYRIKENYLGDARWYKYNGPVAAILMAAGRPTDSSRGKGTLEYPVEDGPDSNPVTIIPMESENPSISNVRIGQ